MIERIFFGVMLGILIRVRIHPQKITQKDKELGNDLNYDGIYFPILGKDFNKIETKIEICINAFCYENKLTFTIYISDQKFENSMDKNKSHYMDIKDFDRIMLHKTKYKNKKYFCKSFSQCFSSKNALEKHREVCFSIKCTQSVKLVKATIEFKNFFKRNTSSI